MWINSLKSSTLKLHSLPALQAQNTISTKKAGLLEYSRSSRNPATARHTSATPPAPHAPEISEESSVIVGLFHDIGNMGMPGKPYYLPVINDGMPTGAYTINPEIVAMGLSLRSLYPVSQYIPS